MFQLVKVQNYFVVQEVLTLQDFTKKQKWQKQLLYRLEIPASK